VAERFCERGVANSETEPGDAGDGPFAFTECVERYMWVHVRACLTCY
jgi:hypothetical protein